MDRGGANVAYIYDLNPGGGGAGGGVPAQQTALLGAANGAQNINVLNTLNQSPMASGLNQGSMLPPQDENYCLRWNDYEKKYAETFRVLRDDEYFADVTLATEMGHSVKAHRVILSACSNYFHAILTKMSPWQHPVLLLQDVRANDLNSLMDFIYFGQASVAQDSLQSFLRVAEKLKIKGLCETAPPPLPQMPPSSHQSPLPQIGLPHHPPPSRSQPTPTVVATVNNFEGLLPRSAYVPEPSVMSLCGSQQSVNSGVPMSTGVIRTVVTSVAPPAAHQSPRHGRSSTRASAENLLHYSSPKRAKYATVSPQSILRNHLQLKDDGHHVEVKSEPMAILSTQEDVPSSGVNVTEFIASHDGEFPLQSLGHGISSQFMFSPDPADNPGGQNGGHGSNGPSAPTATLVTIEEKAASSSSQSGLIANVSTVSTHHLHHMTTHSTPVSVSAHHHHHMQHHHPHDEPQDLTPGPQDSPHTPPSSSSVPTTPTSLPVGVMVSANNSGSNSSLLSSPTPPPPPPPSSSNSKKDRNSRKTCTYCNKDFHEMSLKRHIKDVHFRNQNTYVICPQCCKQYASQNSLYSHLNRVHGVKKDMMPTNLQVHMTSAGNSSGANTSTNAGTSIGNSAGGASTSAASTPQQHGDNHDGIVDLAHHSDSSN